MKDLQINKQSSNSCFKKCIIHSVTFKKYILYTFVAEKNKMLQMADISLYFIFLLRLVLWLNSV